MQKLQIRHLTNGLVLEKEDHDKKKKKQLVVAKERVGIPPPEEVLPLPSVSQPKKHRDGKHRSHSHRLCAPGTSCLPRPRITGFIQAQYSKPSMREHNSCLKDQSAPSCAPLLYWNSVSRRHANPFLTIVQSALDLSTSTPLWSCYMLHARCHFPVFQNETVFSSPFLLQQLWSRCIWMRDVLRHVSKTPPL